MKIVIRKMRQADIPDVIELGEETPEIKTGTSLPQFYGREMLMRWIKRRQSILLVAEVDGLFAGFRIADYNPAAQSGYLEMIAVKNKFRNQGVGKKLTEETLRRLKKMGCDNVWCIIQAKNKRAQAIYESYGFVRGDPFFAYEKKL